MEGKGTFKFANGDIFTGTWVNDEIQGYGEIKYKNKD